MKSSCNIIDRITELEEQTAALDRRDPLHECLYDAKMRYLGASQGIENMDLALRQLALVAEEIRSRTAGVGLPVRAA